MGLLKRIKEGKHVKEGMYTDVLRIPHMTWTFILVKLLKHTRVTPNQVTLFSFILILASSYFFSVGNYGAYLIAAALYYTSFVFDTVDGCLARETGKTSPMGGWYDKTADRLANPVLFFGMAWGVFRNNPVTSVWIWAFVAYAALEYSVIMQYNFRRMFAFGMDIVKKERKKLGFLKEFTLNDFFLMHSIVIFAVLNIVEYYFIFFSFYGWAFDIAMTLVMTRKAKKLLKLHENDSE